MSQSMGTPACMGGWCKKRERCAHYGAEDRRRLVERLCEPGQDGVCLEHAIVRQQRAEFEPAIVPALLRRDWTVFAEVGA